MEHCSAIKVIAQQSQKILEMVAVNLVLNVHYCHFDEVILKHQNLFIII